MKRDTFPAQRLPARLAKFPHYAKFHQCWSNMLGRCYYSKTNRYDRYGGRGIYVCARWHQFSNFYNDMAASFQKHSAENSGNTSLDRKNHDDHYRPGNCQWITREENSSSLLRKVKSHRVMPSKKAYRTSIWFPNREEFEEAKKKAQVRKYPSLSSYIRKHFLSLK